VLLWESGILVLLRLPPESLHSLRFLRHHPILPAGPLPFAAAADVDGWPAFPVDLICARGAMPIQVC
jgi:hypothetical protein